jgi:Mn-containing catalase
MEMQEMQVTQNLMVKEEPSDLSSAATLSANVIEQSPSSTKKQKEIKSEPVTSKKQQVGVVSQEPATTPIKKGKSVNIG